MYRTWTASAGDAATLARDLEAHLNEFADHVISISYAVATSHHALVVYVPVETTGLPAEEAALAVAEHIIDKSPA